MKQCIWYPKTKKGNVVYRCKVCPYKTFYNGEETVEHLAGKFHKNSVKKDQKKKVAEKKEFAHKKGLEHTKKQLKNAKKIEAHRTKVKENKKRKLQDLTPDQVKH